MFFNVAILRMIGLLQTLCRCGIFFLFWFGFWFFDCSVWQESTGGFSLRESFPERFSAIENVAIAVGIVVKGSGRSKK